MGYADMKTRILPILLCAALALSLLSGCGGTKTADAEDVTQAVSTDTAVRSAVDTVPAAETLVTFTADGAVIDGPGAEIDDDGEVDIVSTGTYRITGQSDNGRVVVDAADTDVISLILDGCDLSYAEDEVIYIKTARSAELILADGTENTLTSGVFPTDIALEDVGVDENASGAALRFKCPLTVSGGGKLTVTGLINNGIGGNSNLILDGGVISVTALNDGVKSKESITVNSGVMSVLSYGDGIQAEDTLTIAGGALEITTGSGADTANMKVSDSLMMGMGGPGRGSREASAEADQDADTAEAGQDTADIEEQDETPQGDAAADSQRSSSEMPWDFDDENAVSRKGLKAGTVVVVTDGSIALDTEDDAIHSDGDVILAGGELAVRSGDDGVHADADLTISGGTVDVQYCYEGLEAKQILIEDGYVNVVATDDGMNVNGGNGMFGWASGEASGETEAEDAESESPALRITGGVVTVDSGGDGLDSNGSIYIEGGETYVSGPSSDWDAAVDYGEGGCEFIITGGVLMAGGYSGMAEAPDAVENAQGSIYYRFDDYAGDGAPCILTDADGNVILQYAFAHGYNCVVLSSPAISVGETYTLTAGDQAVTVEMTGASYSNRASRGGFGGMPMGGSREASGETEYEG